MAHANGRPSSPLLIFSDDWGRHPSSCQHLARQLLREHEIHWVNTIGMRPPRLNWSTWHRGVEKIQSWTKHQGQDQQRPADLHVLNPRMWPTFRRPLGRPLNRELLHRQLRAVVKSAGPSAIAITTIPVVADLLGLLPLGRWVYYCVDDFSEWPGMDQAVLGEMEKRLVQRANVLIAASEVLQERLAGMGRTAHLLTHGVDLDFWQPAVQPLALPMLKDLERPLIVFWGLVDARMDGSFIRRLAADLAKGTIVLAGPTAEIDPRVFSVDRVFRLPPIEYTQLPHLAAAASVLIMPYVDLPVTRAIQPLKLKEYLATGKPVVVRDLPATRSWADCLDLATTPEGFSQAVHQRLQTGLPVEQRRARLRLETEGWAVKASAFAHWIGASA
jgi:glycosyltransferase involved in cell wall biosynthesis